MPVIELENFSQHEIFRLWKEGIKRLTEAMSKTL